MIVDHISNRARYYCLGEDYKLALDYFASLSVAALQKENVLLDGGRVTVKIRPMDSRPEHECAFEAHREYADIHFLTYGTEQIGYANVNTLLELSFDAERDMVSLSGSGDKITLHPGWFMITLPQDAHMPCIAPGQPAPIGKMIAKIKV